MKKFFAGIGKYFSDFGTAVVKGDWAVKLSLLVMGIGYFARKQIVKGVLMTILEGLFIVMCVTYAAPNLSKFDTLGDVQFESVFDPLTLTNTVNDYDNSLKILLYSLISLVLIVTFIVIYIANIKHVYKLQQIQEQGGHINKFNDDLHHMINEKFYVTLLALPAAGVVIINIIPLLTMILVAFTNYDQQHMPPNALFTWTGLTNFKNLFTSTTTLTFGYSFTRILAWTLIWAVFATFTTYIGGILLAMFINSQKTKFPKFWRTLFIITIAVPQFVTLLLVRSFFADNGIVNTICSSIGLTSFLQGIGLVSKSLTYIPFLTNPHWAKFMIIMINIWVGVPYQMLVATGILMNIPTDLVESARIDGASRVQAFWKIEMPYILFVTGPALITDFVKNINNFNVIYLLTQDVFVTQNQALANSSAKEIDLLVTWLFRLTNEYYNYKMASVIGICVFIICAGFTLITFTQTIKGDREANFQ